MAPLYRIESASTSVRMSTAKENPVISFHPDVSCIRAANLTLSRPRGEVPKTGDSPVQKAAQAVDKRANNRWKTSRKSVDDPAHKRWIS
jgi:hypothetical protein